MGYQDNFILLAGIIAVVIGGLIMISKFKDRPANEFTRSLGCPADIDEICRYLSQTYNSNVSYTHDITISGTNKTIEAVELSNESFKFFKGIKR